MRATKASSQDMERLFPCDSIAKPPSVDRVNLKGARPMHFSRGDWLLKGTDERYHSRVDRHRLAELRSIAMQTFGYYAQGVGEKTAVLLSDELRAAVIARANAALKVS
jgi:hypothetical protein